MKDRRKSDGRVVPERSTNKRAGKPVRAEAAEGRSPAKGNSGVSPRDRAQMRAALKERLDRVREVAERDKEVRFTTLWHHVYNVDRLREAYFSLSPKAAPGVDGMTWQRYGKNLGENLQDLSGRLKRGAYRAKPVLRAYVPKEDGRQRPIGVPTLEDKIVQRATVEVLNAVYETDFLGFSYGFRPGRNQHNALDALWVGITTKKVNWVLDADIRGFFDAIDHEWLVKFVEHRIADKRVIRHVKKWLKAGIYEEGERREALGGTPQGGSVSPLLANIYLHYVFDLWANRWRNREARGEMILVRYADDFVVGFQHKSDAVRFRSELTDRLREFVLDLHPEKTRLVEFGRFAAERRQERRAGKPETFNFLGFTHCCGKTKKGKFTVKRRTMRKRFSRRLKTVKTELRVRLHKPIPEIGKWLGTVLRGHFNYYGVPSNRRALASMRFWVSRLWYRALRRRSQKAKLTWERMQRLIDRWLPLPQVVHPYPSQRLIVSTRGRSPVR